MMKKLLSIAFVLFFSASLFAQETVPFLNAPSQGSSGIVTYDMTVTGGFTLGSIDWDGFASTINSGTYGSELRCDISGPLGSASLTLGSGTTYSPGANFIGSTGIFNNAGDPAGVWTFDFYESYDDGGDGLPDANWDNIDFTFGLSFANPQITPDLTCQTVAGSWGAGGSVIYEVTMSTMYAYNFSCCANDVCAGACDGDADFTMFDTDGSTQLWYIDGPSGCGYDATTIGSPQEGWIPPADGVYYLQIDDYYNAAASYTLAYVAVLPPPMWIGSAAKSSDWFDGANWSTGVVPIATDDIIIPAGAPSYPVVDAMGAVCNNLQLDNGGMLTMATGGGLDIGGDLTGAGEFIMNDGDCNIAGNLYTPSTGIVTVNGGTLYMTSWFETDYLTWASGTITLSGGTIFCYEHAFFYGGTGVMDGPFELTIGGTIQIGQAMFGTVTGGTVRMLGLLGDGYFLAPSGGDVATAYNLVLLDGFYYFSRDDASEDMVIVNDLEITASSHAVFFSDGGTGGSTGVVDNFTVGGNCIVKPLGRINATVLTNMTVNGKIIIESDASGSGSWIDIGNINGDVEVQSNRIGDNWHFISSPVGDETAGTFSGLYLQSHDEATNMYTDVVSTSTPLNVMQGYALYGEGLATYEGTILNSLDQTTTLTRATDGYQNGWNLVGNPYPSTIDWNAASGWTKTNVNATTWIESNGNWAIWNGTTGTNGGSRYIASAQGYFVEVPDGQTTGTLATNVSVRTHEWVGFVKSEVANLLKVQAEGNGLTDETVIWFNEDATEGYDGEYDAHKLWGTEDYPQFYSLANSNMAINALPPVSYVPMGFKAGVSGNYVISTVEDGGFEDVVLEDLLLNTQTNLLENSYEFDYSTGDDEARFVIHFTPLSVPEGSVNNIESIYSYNNSIYVAVPENTKGNIFVYDIMGREVANSVINGTLNTISLDESGHYVVKVMSNENIITNKVYVK